MRLLFKPATRNLDDALDAGYLQALWRPLEQSYFAALQEVAGLPFTHSIANVRCGQYVSSTSGRIGETAIKIGTHNTRADGSYVHTRRSDHSLLAVLTHELGHRLLAEHGILLRDSTPRENYESHRLLYVFLYDSWVKAFGEVVAGRLAISEREVDHQEYADAWQWAMALDFKSRQELMRHIVEHKVLPGMLRKYVWRPTKN